MDQLKKSIFWNSAGIMTFAASTVLMSVLVTRINGIETGGVFSVAWGIAQNLYQIGILGVDKYQSTDFENKYSFSVYCTVKIISSAMMLALLVIVGILANSKEERFLIYQLGVYMAMYSVSVLFQSLFFQNRRIDLSGKSMYYGFAFSFIVFGVVLLIFKSLPVALVLMNIAYFFVNIFVTVKPAFKYAEIKVSFNRKEITALIGECFPLFIAAFFIILLVNMSRYLLKGYSDATTLGYFNIVFLPMLVINNLSSIIFKPIIPLFYDCMNTKEYKKLYKMIARQIFLILGLTLVGTVVVHSFAMNILSMVFAVDVTPYKTETSLVIFSGFFYAVGVLFYYLLTTFRRQNLILVGYAVAVLLTITLGIVLVKNFGMLGAILSFGTGQVFVAAFFAVCLYRYIKSVK